MRVPRNGNVSRSASVLVPISGIVSYPAEISAYADRRPEGFNTPAPVQGAITINEPNREVKMEERIVAQHLYYVVFSYPHEESVSGDHAPAYVYYATDDAEAEELGVSMSYEGIKELTGLFRIGSDNRMSQVKTSPAITTSLRRLSNAEKQEIGLRLVGSISLMDITSIPVLRARVVLISENG